MTKPKKIFIIIFIIIAAVAISAGLLDSKKKKSAPEFVVAQKMDLSQEVSVTGRVKPASIVELAFEKSGKVEQAEIKVGDRVAVGQLLVGLANADLSAQLKQTELEVENAQWQLAQLQAAQDQEQAKLSELNRGARPEEIQIAATKKNNAQNSLADAEINLSKIKNLTQTKSANAQKALLDAEKNLISAGNKADIDLANLYDDADDILNDAYNKADDAINKQIDELFNNDATANPQLTFTTTNSQAKIDAERQRVMAGEALGNFKTELDGLSSDYNQLDQSVSQAENYLTIIRNFLIKLDESLNGAANLTQTAITAYKTYLNTGRANVNTVITNMNAQTQLIAAQKTTNQNNITTAEAKINDAESALSLTEVVNQNDLAMSEAKVSEAQNVLAIAIDELLLKQAGSAVEQINAQEAKVAQSGLNISSQQIRIKQAKANAQNLQAQLAKTMLYSPISGLVTKQEAKLGEIISANTIIVSVISPEQFEIEANIPEADIAKVRIGNTAKITLDAYESTVDFIAKVISIEPAETMIDGVATYKTVLAFQTEDERIKSGMTANVDISTDKRQQVIAIPERAVISKNGDKFVKILNNDLDAVEVKIITGLRGSDGNIEIISGVGEGGRVVF